MTQATQAQMAYQRRPLPDGLTGAALTNWLTQEFQRVQGGTLGSVVRTASANTLQVVSDRYLLVDATAGNVSVTLLAPALWRPVPFLVMKVDNSANTVTLTGTVNGASNPTITAQYEAYDMVSDGTAIRTTSVSSGGGGTIGKLSFSTHLSASPASTFNGSVDTTLSTDATSANTVSTIVARDASGNFSAGAVSVSSLTATATVSGADLEIATNAHHLKGVQTSSAVVNLLSVSSTNATRFNAAVDSAGFEWTNQAETLQWMSLKPGIILTVWTAGSATAGGGIAIGVDGSSNPAIKNVDPNHHQFGQGSLKLMPTTISGGHGQGAVIALSCFSGVSQVDVVSAANVASGNPTLALMAGGGATVFGTDPTGSQIVRVGGAFKASGAVQLSNYGSGLATFDASGNITSSGGPLPPASTITASQVTGTPPTGAGTFGAGSYVFPSDLGITTSLTVGSQISILTGAPLVIYPTGLSGNSVTASVTTQTVGSTTLTIPDFASVSDTFAFVGLAQTFTNKTLSTGCAVPASLVTAGTFGAGDYVFPANLAITSNAVIGSASVDPRFALNVSGSVTASGTTARGIFVNTQLNAVANGDQLVGGYFNETFSTGALTGVSAVGVLVAGISTASFVSPTNVIGLSIGVMNGSGTTANAPNAFGILIGIPTGATANWLISATSTSLFSVTSAGALRLASTIGIDVAPATNIGLAMSSSLALTAIAGVARMVSISGNLTASANSDNLIGMVFAPTLTPGAFTGVAATGVVLNGFSTATFTTPADPILLNLGNLVGTNATNATLLRLGTVSGASGNNYLIATATVSTFNVTAAGALTLASTITAGGLVTANNGLTVATGKTLTLTNATVAGAPTWSLGQTFPSVTTGAPSGGTAGTWKLGILVTAAVVPDTTRYIQLDVGGTLYKLIVST